jgi:hypothetical protein
MEGNRDERLRETLARLDTLLDKPVYIEDDRTEITELLIALGLEGGDEGDGVVLRQIRGRLVRRPPSGGIEVVATGRSDWVGSVEAKE